MQPELPPDTNAPELPPGKTGFWDKLKAVFKKKVASPAEPPLESHTPAPELDEEADRNTIPTDEVVQADENTQVSDQENDEPFSTRESAPDDDGERTAPELDVPDELLNKEDTVESSPVESPDETLGVPDEPSQSPQSGQQPPQPPVQPRQ